MDRSHKDWTWVLEAACRSAPSAVFFVTDESLEHMARLYCERCPVREPCLETALVHEETGIWGGTNDRERQRILAQRRRGRAS